MTEKDTSELWNKYFADRSVENKNAIICEYTKLVRYVLQKMTLPGNSILKYEDFVNIGILGLNEAVERFDPEKGVKFETYASTRVRGVILDEMRKMDWLSRTARKRVQELTAATDEIRRENFGNITAEDVRKKLNISYSEYQTYLAAAESARVSFNLNESTKVSIGDDEYDFINELPDNDAVSILDKIENEERLNCIKKYLLSIPEKKRLVVTLYYFEELNFKEIGEVLKVSESRVCQIHTQIIKELRTQLNENAYA